MTRESMRFQLALLISLVLHGVLSLLFFTLPGGGPSEPVQVYTVRITEAPGRPEAQELPLSTQAISALRLESPTLKPDTPPVPVPESPDIPTQELFPDRPSQLPTPESAPALPATETPATIQTPPAQTPTAPPASAVPGAPALPGLPQAPGAPPAAPQAPASVPGTPSAVPLPPAPDRESERPSLMERTRGRIRQLNLEVDAALPAPSPGRPQTPGTERNLLSLRMYSNRVREAVQKRFTFPGAFESTLRTRVRVTLNRDGTVRAAEIMESSGNERFDTLVCLGAINRAEIPEVPKDIEEETLTLNFTCSP